MQTVDQFFALKVPMSVGELNSLCRGLDNTFQIYTQGVTEKLGEFLLHTFLRENQIDFICIALYLEHKLIWSLAYF